MAIGNMHKKFGEDRTCSSEGIIADRQTDKHSYNTPLHYRGRSNQLDTHYSHNNSRHNTVFKSYSQTKQTPV